MGKLMKTGYKEKGKALADKWGLKPFGNKR